MGRPTRLKEDHFSTQQIYFLVIKEIKTNKPQMNTKKKNHIHNHERTIERIHLNIYTWITSWYQNYSVILLCYRSWNNSCSRIESHTILLKLISIEFFIKGTCISSCHSWSLHHGDQKLQKHRAERSLYNLLAVISILPGVIHGSHNTTCNATCVENMNLRTCFFDAVNTCTLLLVKLVTVSWHQTRRICMA